MTTVELNLVNLADKRTRPAMPRLPVLSSVQAPWQGVRVEQFNGGPCEVSGEAPLNHLVAVQLEQPAEIDWGPVGQSRTVQILPGQVSFHPAFTPITARTRDTRDFILVALDPSFVLCAALESFPSDRFEFVQRTAVSDPLVRSLALALHAEVSTGCPGGRWYGESLAHTLALHLLRHYSAQTPAAPSSNGGLAPNQLRRALELIHARYAEDLSLDAVASVAGLSPFHFARQFKKSVGVAPHQYLIRRRLDRARELILTTDTDIAQIALQTGFYDQSHFAAHFKRAYGVTPRQIRRRGGPHTRLPASAALSVPTLPPHERIPGPMPAGMRAVAPAA